MADREKLEDDREAGVEADQASDQPGDSTIRAPYGAPEPGAGEYVEEGNTETEDQKAGDIRDDEE